MHLRLEKRDAIRFVQNGILSGSVGAAFEIQEAVFYQVCAKRYIRRGSFKVEK